MGYNPGIVDRSGEIRAQGMLAGGQGLLGGLEQGVDLWKKNKDEEKKLQASIKSAEALIQSISPIATQINPEFDKIIKDLSLKVSDPKLSTLERATLSQSALKGIGDLMGSGLELKKMQAEQARQQEVAKAQIAADTAKVQQMQRAQAVQQLVGIGRANQGNIPVQLLEKVDPGMYAEAQNILDKIRKDNTRTYETVDENGYVTTVTEDPFLGRIGSAPKLPAGMKMPARGQAQGDASDPFTAVQQAVQPEVIPNSSEARMREKEQRDIVAAEEAKAATAEDLKGRVESTLTNVNDAIKLVRGGAGGPLQGIEAAASVGNIGWGGESKQLINRISSIKAALRFINLQAIRQASKTGGAVGNLSNEEGRALESDIAALDPTLDEKEQEVLLRRIGEKLAKVGKVEWKPDGAPNGGEVRQQSGKGQPKTAEDILKQYGK